MFVVYYVLRRRRLKKDCIYVVHGLRKFGTIAILGLWSGSHQCDILAGIFEGGERARVRALDLHLSGLSTSLHSSLFVGTRNKPCTSKQLTAPTLPPPTAPSSALTLTSTRPPTSAPNAPAQPANSPSNLAPISRGRLGMEPRRGRSLGKVHDRVDTKRI